MRKRVRKGSKFTAEDRALRNDTQLSEFPVTDRFCCVSYLKGVIALSVVPGFLGRIGHISYDQVHWHACKWQCCGQFERLDNKRHHLGHVFGVTSLYACFECADCQKCTSQGLSGNGVL